MIDDETQTETPTPTTTTEVAVSDAHIAAIALSVFRQGAAIMSKEIMAALVARDTATDDRLAEQLAAFEAIFVAVVARLESKQQKQ